MNMVSCQMFHDSCWMREVYVPIKDPFLKTVIMHVTVINIVHPQKYFIFFFFKCMYIYNTNLCIIFTFASKLQKNSLH